MSSCFSVCYDLEACSKSLFRRNYNIFELYCIHTDYLNNVQNSVKFLSSLSKFPVQFLFCFRQKEVLLSNLVTTILPECADFNSHAQTFSIINVIILQAESGVLSSASFVSLFFVALSVLRALNTLLSPTVHRLYLNKFLYSGALRTLRTFRSCQLQIITCTMHIALFNLRKKVDRLIPLMT